MSETGLILVLLLVLPLLPAGISALTGLPGIPGPRWRGLVNLASAAAKLAVVAWALAGVARGEIYEWRYALVPGLELVLQLDALSLLFITLSSLLWLITTAYAIGYLRGTPNQARFFLFFNLCIMATTGIALSGSLITFFVFYEVLTLATWPLVVHKGDATSIKAGRTYLIYTMSGSAALLAGIVWLETGAGPVVFADGADLSAHSPAALAAIFALLIGGLGVKAAIVPFHAWLPAAMAAPAPVSALLHAVAVVKAGAFGIIRVIYDVFGIENVASLGLGLPLAVIASISILYSSVQALRQSEIKPRLAYSTASQLSYIILGASLAGPYALIGGLTHLVHQGIMKITLFFAAGALEKRTGVHSLDALDGMGRHMPLTMTAFTIGALGMIGLPPTAGFVTKWYLSIGGLQTGAGWVVAVLAASTLLNAAYFLPPVYRAWMKPAREDQPAPPGGRRPWLLIAPAAITAAVTLLAGLLAGLAWSPLGWASLIMERVYLP